MRNFDNLLSEVNFAKKSDINLSEEALADAAEQIITKFKQIGVLFKNMEHRPAVKNVDYFTGKETNLPETYSFFVGKGFINISANGSCFYKNNGDIKTIATFGTGEVAYTENTSPIINSLIDWQKKSMA